MSIDFRHMPRSLLTLVDNKSSLIQHPRLATTRLFASKPRQHFLVLRDDQSSETYPLGVTTVHLILQMLPLQFCNQ